MRPDYLDDALGRTGVSLTEGRARELLAVARSHDAFVLEDDYARHMTHDDGIPPVKPLVLLETDGTVIHIRSLARLQTALTQRRRLAIRAVVETLGADVLPDHPRGGYHLWLHLPRGTDESEFLSAALARGTALAPGTYFHADQPDVPRVRLSYAAAPTTADLVTGIHRLEGLVRGGPLQHRGPVSGCGACDGPRGARAPGPWLRPAP